jgi:ATP-dependent RNA helicase SUPV3L1/SUV3
MLLGSSVMEPMIRALVPQAEIVSRPRFPRFRSRGEETVARAAAQRHRRLFRRAGLCRGRNAAPVSRRGGGGDGALSPETRNRQVALYQAGEVDYLVATDAIGMGLNLDIAHVAFAGLSKYDGRRQRRLLPTEMAQIAGRAGRHQRTAPLARWRAARGMARRMPNSRMKIYAIEEHASRPDAALLARIRSALRFGGHADGSLERPPAHPALMAARGDRSGRAQAAGRG